MLDHALGRPSAGLKRIQVVLITVLAYYVLKKKPSSAAANNTRIALFLRWFNQKVGSAPPWKIVFGTLSVAWIAKNLLLLVGGNAPEPLARMYTRSFYRGTYVLTGLDAGFLTVMNVKPKWLRDILSIVCSIFYLVFPDTADEKVRKFRAHPTIDMLRVSWNKSMNPYLRMITARHRPHITIRKDITIARPDPPSISSFPDRVLEPIQARLYFNGTDRELARARELVFLLPGGGFVAMGPKCHEDHVSVWAKTSKVPILAVDYGKAPEFPYPFALEECFDAYRSVVESNGAAIGMQGWWEDGPDGQPVKKAPIKIVMAGDSAGGNLVVGVVMRCLETYEKHIPPPNGIVLIYPCLSFDMSCWMPSEQLKLMRAESHKNLALKNLTNSKSTMKKNSPLTPQDAPRKIDVLNDQSDHSKSWYSFMKPKRNGPERIQGPSIPSSLSMTSRMSYFTDRVISPEMMRAMALLYLGTSPTPVDLASDYYLSPVMAPDDLLARFPKTYLLCGEKDPFVDDTVVFAGRLRENKLKARKEWERMMATIDGGAKKLNVNGKVNGKVNGAAINGLHVNGNTLNGADNPIRTHIFSREPDSMVRVKILEGVSHGFFQMLALLPEAKQATRLTADWFTEMLADPGVDDHGDDLTEFMINDIHAMEGESEGPQPGPYYPAYGVPQAAPSPHINLSSDNLAASSNSLHVRFRENGKGGENHHPQHHYNSSAYLHNITNGSMSELSSPTTYDSNTSLSSQDDSVTSPAPVMDEVDEKKILERRRTELGSVLYSLEG
ncbi:hypothetical protein PhCBS80983_g03144 [Powellomyces hirtus]|uniref:Alpha/beta hydrolase fold-3 domain-containing protein n=1 Tax=Powellomyces hirtus TaxID=109895 RepID=A0A507E413_9FUNG|nr:hypothetical protein PhCBS80983_g03144 [Powellomyces hirtus]